MDRQNITLSLPKDVLQKAKILAIQHNTSLSAYLTQVLEERVAADEAYQAARHSHIRRLEQGVDLGTQGVINWSRGELHVR
jgi:hypothetical protein